VGLLSAEDLRKKHLAEKGIGLVSIQDRYLRVAFSSVDENGVEEPTSASPTPLGSWRGRAIGRAALREARREPILGTCFSDQSSSLCSRFSARDGHPGASEAQEGVASWYGPGFHGKKTANGEIL
jgi:hypothetical protein